MVRRTRLAKSCDLAHNLLPESMPTTTCRSNGFAIVYVLFLLPMAWLANGLDRVNHAFGGENSLRKPNIVFVLADDLGWSELGCYGNRFHETPNIDLMGRAGVRFVQAYASAPVCSPYRASLLTGQYPARHGILDYLRPNSSRSIDSELSTLPELLRKNGYSTGMIGKWHLSGYKFHGAEFEQQPKDHGFDFQIGNELKGVGNGANSWPYVFRDQQVRWVNFEKNRLGKDEYLVDRMNLEAVEFIERNKERPFFLYLSHYATHSILNGKKDLVEKYRKKHPPGPSTRHKCYLCEDAGQGEGDPLNHWAKDHNPHLAAMLESIDDGIGMITRKLRQLGLEENTIVVFTSDNGGERNVTSNAPLRGGKSQLYEGGLRVPLVVKWPRSIPKNRVSRQVTCNIDFLPTLLEATGVESKPQQAIDGISILENLKSPRTVDNGRTLYWHYPLDKPHFLGGKSGGALLKEGRWKLVKGFQDDAIELYDLQEDLSESTNALDALAKDSESEILSSLVLELSAELEKWQKEVAARFPSRPKLVQPNRLLFGDCFYPANISSRWFFGTWYEPKAGVLRRTTVPGESKRTFVKDPSFGNSMIRFDFKFGLADEIRLVTGTKGIYNTVVHIRPDRFFIQTASDKTVPYFPSFQGLCWSDFEREKWYTMTIEFLEDVAVAHHTDSPGAYAYAVHPMINRTRTYLAVQTDKAGVAIDNFELYGARSQKNWQETRSGLESGQDARVNRKKLEIADEYNFLKANTVDRLYRGDEHYRKLVDNVELEKKRQRETYPEVFSSIKQVRKQIGEYRKQLKETDAQYNRITKSINQSNRAIVDYVLAKNPQIEELPKNQQLPEIETAKQGLKEDAEFRVLQKQLATRESELLRSFPKLFLTNEQIQATQREFRNKKKEDPGFKTQIKGTAAAVHAERDYLFEKSSRLKELHQILFEKK